MVFKRDKRMHVLKSLTALSKFLGAYHQFKQRTQNFGVKWQVPTALETFNHMLQKNNENVFEWAKKTDKALPMHKEFLRFARLSGLRKSESINSFNLIISLSRKNHLSEYYTEETSCLEHFRFPEIFIRRTKSAYITFIPKEQILSITKSRKISYEKIRKKLVRRGMSTKLSLLRCTWATFMEKRLSQAEVDLLQGRVSQSVFMRFYFAPDLKELKEKVLWASRELAARYV